MKASIGPTASRRTEILGWSPSVYQIFWAEFLTARSSG